MDDGDHDRTNEGGNDDGKDDRGDPKVVTDMITNRARKIHLLTKNMFCKNPIYEGHAPDGPHDALVKHGETSYQLLLFIIQHSGGFACPIPLSFDHVILTKYFRLVV